MFENAIDIDRESLMMMGSRRRHRFQSPGWKGGCFFVGA